MSKTIKPGDRVRDKLSGAEGTVVARTEWLYGCVRLMVQPKAIKDGQPCDTFNIDEPQAEIITAPKVEPAPKVTVNARWLVNR